MSLSTDDTSRKGKYEVGGPMPEDIREMIGNPDSSREGEFVNSPKQTLPRTPKIKKGKHAKKESPTKLISSPKTTLRGRRGKTKKTP